MTQEYKVEGPVMIMLTTTAIDIDEELLNRCIVLSVDERRGADRALIHGDAAARPDTVTGACSRTSDRKALRHALAPKRAAAACARVTRRQSRTPSSSPFERTRTRLRARRDNAKYLALDP